VNEEPQVSSREEALNLVEFGFLIWEPRKNLILITTDYGEIVFKIAYLYFGATTNPCLQPPLCKTLESAAVDPLI
jgi:hypothetical protein